MTPMLTDPWVSRNKFLDGGRSVQDKTQDSDAGNQKTDNSQDHSRFSFGSFRPNGFKRTLDVRLQKFNLLSNYTIIWLNGHLRVI